MNFKITELEATDSTNNEIKKLAESGGEEGTVIIARSQTGGKGSHGRSFLSPQGGLYMSLLLRPKSTGHITAMAAVAGVRALYLVCGADAGIKWTNDIYLGGKKLAGILTEGAFGEDGNLKYAVLGIGINIGHIDFGKELEGKAASLEDFGFYPDRRELASAFLHEFDRLYTRKADWLPCYREKSVVLGKKVTVSTYNESYNATASEIDNNGYLIVTKENGEKFTLISGEVSVRGDFS